MAVAAIAVFAVDVVLLTHWNETTPISRDQALAQFRGRGTLVPTPSVDEPRGATPSTATTLPKPAPARSPGGSMVRPRGDVASAGRFRSPSPGVYTYDTTGGETISFGGAHHDYPAETYGTVRVSTGCQWQLDQTLVKEHTDRRVYCGTIGRLVFLEQTTVETFYGQSTTEDYRCDPPQVVIQDGDTLGSSRDSVCRSPDSEIQARTTYIESTTLPVAGAPAPVEHIVVTTTVSGRASGSGRSEQWLAADTGLLVREVRSTATTAHQFGAAVNYDEHATFELRSLSPAT